MRKPNIVIIDYDLGNLFSVKLACESIGLNAEISSDKNKILASDAIILPGVGAFADAMANLKRFDLITPIKDHVQSGKPMMGVCLGMQLLFTKSEEFGSSEGLNLIPGEIKKLRSSERSIKVPQIGWNKIAPGSVPWNKTPLTSTPLGSYMYFVHSFYAVPAEENVILTNTEYEGIRYCSGVFKNNIFATQFHPEKSTDAGVRIYEEWALMNNLIPIKNN